MSYDFGKQINVSKLKKTILKKVNTAIENESKKVLATLRRRVNFSEGSDYGKGISAYDYIGNSSKSYKRWDANVRMVGNSIRAEFDNSAKYAVYLYTKTRSVGHKNGFRSAYPHEENARIMVNGRLVETGKTRENQTSFAKWMKFNRDVKQSMITNIKKEFEIK